MSWTISDWFSPISKAWDCAAFDADSRTRDAVERCLERLSEAAAKLGTQLTSSRRAAVARNQGFRERVAARL